MGATATRLSYPTGEGVAGEVTAVFRPLLAGGGGEGDPPLGRAGRWSLGRAVWVAVPRERAAGWPAGRAGFGGRGGDRARAPPAFRGRREFSVWEAGGAPCADRARAMLRGG